MNHVLLICVNVVWRICRRSVTNAPHKNLEPNSKMFVKILGIGGVFPIQKNNPCNLFHFIFLSQHLKAAFSRTNMIEKHINRLLRNGDLYFVTPKTLLEDS